MRCVYCGSEDSTWREDLDLELCEACYATQYNNTLQWRDHGNGSRATITDGEIYIEGLSRGYKLTICLIENRHDLKIRKDWVVYFDKNFTTIDGVKQYAADYLPKLEKMRREREKLRTTSN